SAYARQFLGQLDKPDVDHIAGLSPAIAIDQKSTSHNPRSTVGTVTEIYDYLRLLYARIGTPYCPTCDQPINPQTIEQMVDRILQFPEGTRFQVLSPLVRGRKGEYRQLLEEARRDGFVRARIDGKIWELSDNIPLEKHQKHDIAVVVDRLVARSDIATRLADSLAQALKKAEGIVLIDILDTTTESKGELLLSERLACPDCGFAIADIEPRLFSFNSPFGACTACHGLGNRREFDPERVVPDQSRPLKSAIVPWVRSGNPYYQQLLGAIARHLGVALETPWEELPARAREVILHGTAEPLAIPLGSQSWFKPGDGEYTTRYEGVIRQLARRYAETTSDKLKEEFEAYQTNRPCENCQGKRLRPESLAVRVAGRSIAELTALGIAEVQQSLRQLTLSPRQQRIAEQILKELRARLQFLVDVGLDYLTLARSANTLSGGEAQRIRLATQIGSGLTGVMYVLDEPSIGLHQRDNLRLLATLKQLRDLGNTVLVVEHDTETIMNADYVLDIGPGAGIHGGQIVVAGTPEQVAQAAESLTGQFLSGSRSIAVPTCRRAGNGQHLLLLGCRINNLKDFDVTVPLGKFVCVTGVSGSGKSSLVNELLLPVLQFHLHGSARPAGLRDVRGLAALDKAIVIDQSPIGRTPRSNPATYTGLFDVIRETFAKTSEAKARGYEPGRFSFNVKGGRCEACGGEGLNRIEMHFLPDVFVNCEVCQGKRYNRETLEIRFKGNNIAAVLDMTVEEALDFFQNLPRAKSRLQTLYDVGLGYLKLGQPATTLSGGEAQRVKLAEQLARRSTGKTLLLLDEPTTGLSAYDVAKLLEVLQRLVDAGNSIVCIEHNLDVIKCADQLIDLGPEGGDRGGYIVATGTPEEVANNPASFTGQFLRPLLPAFTPETIVVPELA
ncbi:MAG: excinuclease ABC subunit UvrA, partial [Cyanobacteria bacterium NC_groundwater_1444_Ag_S-0.65um_54_12]|nr:excinuclease ABC subunit UvrA [Cyanobacteria bacterium NC_groundwater_1444_Ag_S-0.65um_54_12]